MHVEIGVGTSADAPPKRCHSNRSLNFSQNLAQNRSKRGGIVGSKSQCLEFVGKISMLAIKKHAPIMFTVRTPNNDPIGDSRKYNICVPKSQGLSKLWVLGLILCFILCITVICVAIWVVSLLRDAHETHLDFEPALKHQNAEEFVGAQNFLGHRKNESPPLDEIPFVPDNFIDDEQDRNNPEDVPSEEIHQIQSDGSSSDHSPTDESKIHKERVPQNYKFDNLESIFRPIFELDSIGKTLDSILPTKQNSSAPDKSNFKTQISSPDAIVAQVTTDLLRVNEYLSNRDAKKSDSTKDKKRIEKKKDREEMDSQKFIENLAGYLNILGQEKVSKEASYPDDYFYSEGDAQVFYYDYEKVTWASYLLEKIQELYDWVTTDLELNDGHFSKANENAPLPQILRALNRTIIKGDASILFFKLRDLYFSENGTEFDPEKSRKMLTNTSSVVSFGFLALDVVLLRNIQIISWEDQSTADKEMVKDIEVFAMNSIFMDREKVKRMYREIQLRSTLSPHELENWDRISTLQRTKDGKNVDYSNVGTEMAEEFIHFVTSTVRAVIHLGQAFRTARTHLENQRSDKRLYIRGHTNKLETDRTEIDCIWTLYCRNLDKGTKLSGASGVLAKLNSIGLRLILGELKIERILEAAIEETMSESKPLNCGKLFPKCTTEDAPRIVIERIVKEK